MRTITVEDDAAVLVLDANGDLEVLVNEPENLDENVPMHVMLLASLAICVTKRPGWVTEAIEWTLKERDNNVEVRGKLQKDSERSQ